MRILLAIDGSATADRAVELVRSSIWAAPATVRVVTVDESVAELNAAPWLGEPLVDHGPSWHHTRLLYGIVERAEASLRREELRVEGKVLNGRAADEIVREAFAFGADVVVVGSRGLGTIQTMVLGSVSAEVVDRAPCPVLVARTGSVESMVIGLDGSPCSERAVEFVADNLLFPTAEAIVASAVPPPVPVLLALSGGYIVDERAPASSRASHEAIVQRGAARLRLPGREVRKAVVEGDAPAALMDVATANAADLIVLGTHGRTGVRRLILGSVARNVLLHAACSVLIVRERRAVRVPAAEREARETAVEQFPVGVATP